MPYGADAQRDAVGRGLGYPIDVGATGRVNWSVPLDSITEDDHRKAMGDKIRHLLLTIAGQRCLRRGWGTNIAGLLFLPMQAPLVASIVREAVTAIRRELPGLALIGADATIDAALGAVTFTFEWRMVSTGLAGAAIVPIGLESREAVLG
jgi:phage baseplate assembly protein W